MKRYKLKKLYPFCNYKLGAIVEIHELDNDNYKNFPDNWEDITKDNYEILSFICLKCKYKKTENGDYIQSEENWSNGHSVLKLENLIEREHTYKIHSVKRLSDGEVFTIGDRVIRGSSDGCTSPCKAVRNISRIYIKHNALLFDDLDGGINTAFQLLLFLKIKQPLFTTEDGIDIYENDTVYEVKKSFEIFYYDQWRSHFGNNGKPINNNKTFSTREKAKKYILDNRPCLSFNEVIECLGDFTYTVKALEKLVKSKIE